MSSPPDTDSVVLGIETSGSVGSVAVVRDHSLLAQHFFHKGLRHGTDLVPSLDTITRQLGLSPRDASLIAVGIGPGSYTGLRVGVASAKALAFALAVPLVGVPSSHAAACNLPATPDARVNVLIDAKRHMLYVCEYRSDGQSWLPMGEHRLLAPDRALEELQREVPVLGDGVTRYRGLFEEAGFTLLAEAQGTPAAGWIARLGLKAYDDRPKDELLTVEPLYLRLSEAQERNK